MSTDNHEQTELVKHGLTISLNRPIVDFSRCTSAALTLHGLGAQDTFDHKSEFTLHPVRRIVCSSPTIVASLDALGLCVDQIEWVIPENATVSLTILLSVQGSYAVTQRITANAGSNAFVTIVADSAVHSHIFSLLQSDIAKDASVTIHMLDLSRGFSEQSIINHLNSAGASAYIHAASVLQGNSQQDLFTESFHAAAFTKSDILARALVFGNAKSVSRSLVKIGQHANGSEGYEKQEALLFSQTAEADAIPNLEIHNHDVKCSHGSSVGHLDEEHIYYMQSRGMNRAQAIALLVEGLLAQTLMHTPLDVQCKTSATITERLYQAQEAQDLDPLQGK
ncbi:MAG TPA: SufD family Fe-S cluster assembly protein [Acidobacteriota bacterium]|nr:SufD family Fe-S cluster assembly protein [Acidobacteriota bacterium]